MKFEKLKPGMVVYDENKEWGSDWEEIEEARAIAEAALKP